MTSDKKSSNSEYPKSRKERAFGTLGGPFCADIATTQPGEASRQCGFRHSSFLWHSDFVIRMSFVICHSDLSRHDRPAIQIVVVGEHGGASVCRDCRSGARGGRAGGIIHR